MITNPVPPYINPSNLSNQLNKERLISVIIPIYNRANLIVETLRSIEAQHLQPFELVIVDDMSTDNSADVVRHFSRTSNLNIILIKNTRSKGVSGALNTGIESARGDYIAFQDSDDLWTPTHLSQLYNSLLKFSAAEIAFSGIEFFGTAEGVDENTQSFSKSVATCLNESFDKVTDEIWLSNSRLLYSLLQHGFPFRCPASLINRSFFSRTGLLFDEELDYTQDSQFMTFAAYHARFLYTKNLGLRIRRHPENAAPGHYGEKIITSHEMRVSKLKSYFRGRKISTAERKALSVRLWCLRSAVMEARMQGKPLHFRAREGLKLIAAVPTIASVKTFIKKVLINQ